MSSASDCRPVRSLSAGPPSPWERNTVNLTLGRLQHVAHQVERCSRRCRTKPMGEPSPHHHGGSLWRVVLVGPVLFPLRSPTSNAGWREQGMKRSLTGNRQQTSKATRQGWWWRSRRWRRVQLCAQWGPPPPHCGQRQPRQQYLGHGGWVARTFGFSPRDRRVGMERCHQQKASPTPARHRGRWPRRPPYSTRSRQR